MSENKVSGFVGALLETMASIVAEHDKSEIEMDSVRFVTTRDLRVGILVFASKFAVEWGSAIFKALNMPPDSPSAKRAEILVWMGHQAKLFDVYKPGAVGWKIAYGLEGEPVLLMAVTGKDLIPDFAAAFKQLKAAHGIK